MLQCHRGAARHTAASQKAADDQEASPETTRDMFSKTRAHCALSIVLREMKIPRLGTKKAHADLHHGTQEMVRVRFSARCYGSARSGSGSRMHVCRGHIIGTPRSSVKYMVESDEFEKPYRSNDTWIER